MEKRISRKILEGAKTPVFLILSLLVVFFCGTATASDDSATKPINVDISLQKLKFGLLAYIEYSAGTKPMAKAVDVDQGENYNQFALTRGYINFMAEITPYLSVRITPDIYEETKGKGTSGDGSYNMRLKYYYAEFKLRDLGPLTSMKSEFGMGHIPWLDFEESINVYRCQGTMAIERAGVLSSADLGLNLQGYIGGTLEDAKKKTGNGSYAGKYGSWHVGVYNGSGYSAVENNQNKVVEGRLTLRPFSMIDALAGLQISYFGLVGEGNTLYQKDKDDYWPKYAVNLGMLSYEHPYFVFTGQYFQTQGNAKGTWVFTNKNGDPSTLTTDGYSFFLNVKPPILHNKPAVFARYDYFNEDAGDDIFVPATPTSKKKDANTSYNTMIGGISYDFYKGNMIVLAYEQTHYGDDADVKGNIPIIGNKLGDEKKFQLVLQLKM